MKSTLSGNSENKEKPFPKLMIATDGDIVLFSAYETGCYVHVEKGSCAEEGSIDTDFDMEYFKDYEGSVSLSND